MSRSSHVSHVDAAAQFDSETDNPSTPLVINVDEDTQPTRSIGPIRAQLLEKVNELENKLKESEDQSTFK